MRRSRNTVVKTAATAADGSEPEESPPSVGPLGTGIDMDGQTRIAVTLGMDKIELTAFSTFVSSKFASSWSSSGHCDTMLENWDACASDQDENWLW